MSFLTVLAAVTVTITALAAPPARSIDPAQGRTKPETGEARSAPGPRGARDTVAAVSCRSCRGSGTGTIASRRNRRRPSATSIRDCGSPTPSTTTRRCGRSSEAVAARSRVRDVPLGRGVRARPEHQPADGRRQAKPRALEAIAAGSAPEERGDAARARADRGDGGPLRRAGGRQPRGARHRVRERDAHGRAALPDRRRRAGAVRRRDDEPAARGTSGRGTAGRSRARRAGRVARARARARAGPCRRAATSTSTRSRPPRRRSARCRAPSGCRG